MSEKQSFGQRAVALSGPTSLIDLELREGRLLFFTDIDALTADVAVRALKGETTLEVEIGRRTDSVSIPGLDQRLQNVLVNQFSVEHQHAKGAWFLPEKATLKAGWMDLPSVLARNPRFATGIAWEARARLVLADNPASVFLWAVLEPFFDQLFLPLELSGRLAGTQDPQEVFAAWSSVDELTAALGVDVADELVLLRDGRRWLQLSAAQQLAARQQLLGALASQASEQFAAKYRAYRVLPLITRYYKKATNGSALRKRVLTRGLEKTLAGFFAGDWLQLLRYLGETPHPEEEIVVAIPHVKLFVGSAKSPTAVAAELGLPVEEVTRAMSTYWDTAGEPVTSPLPPIQARIDVLMAFWPLFDEAHARQAPGMPSLWGFVEDSHGIRLGWEGPEWYSPRLYRELLPSRFLSDVERLWASTMLPRWPDRIVSEISPHALMAEAFGPALVFWHGAALTAWFVCEGPMSRTDMAGLATYYQDQLTELGELGCPIDPRLFAELREAETRLGPPQPLLRNSESVQVAEGVSLEVSMTTGVRRAGFEKLRDIITRHRRAWADQYLKSYLRGRWDRELREAGRLHAQAIAKMGKSPTPKQFARHAAQVTNHWFGGDLSAFYAAIGERSGTHPVRVSLVPPDRLGFAKRVFEGLGGRPFEKRVMVSSREEARAQAQDQERHTKLAWLAQESLRLTQLEEALGRVPKVDELGASEFEFRSNVLSSDPAQAWQKYTQIVEAVRTEFQGLLLD